MPSSPFPPVSFYFRAQFHGINSTDTINFKEVSGISMDLSSDDVHVGGDSQFRHRLPTTAKYQNLILKRGLLTSTSIRQWLEKGINDFQVTPINITLELLNNEERAIMVWTFQKAWPIKWEVSNFNSQDNTIAIASLEIAYDFFEVKNN